MPGVSAALRVRPAEASAHPAARRPRGPWAPVIVALLLLMMPLVTAPARAASDFPSLTGRVVDDAGVLDGPTRQALTEKLAAYEKASSDQIVVATVPSLGGAPLEDYANRLFRAWGLGQAGENNGVLLLVAVDDRKIRIEVGYGLEGTLTDAMSKLIIENDMVPAFRAGDYGAGVTRAVDDIIAVIGGDTAGLEARAEKARQAASAKDTQGNVFALIFFAIVFGMFLFGGLAPLFGRRIGPGRYRWLGMTIAAAEMQRRRSGWGGGGSGWGGGGFSGGGGSSGGGGASGGW